MPDWTAPFHMPHMTTEEFLKKKAEYVAKYGYRYTIPGFDDIFHIPIEAPITEEEDKLWKARRYDEISPERREEIEYIKAKRKAKYLDMLGSPLPEIFNSRAALLTAIDDAQDACSTLAIAGMVASRAMPPAARVVMMAGTGWIMVAGQVLNLATFGLAPEQMALSRKRIQDQMTKDNPFTKKARLKNARKILRGGFGFGAALEVAQTTDQVFGWGISLGAVMSLPLAITFGAAKLITGRPLTVYWPVPHIPRWRRIAKKMHPAMLAFNGVLWQTDDIEMTGYMMASNAAAQMELTDFSEWNPLDAVRRPDLATIPAPTPTKGYLIEILEETDPNWRDTVLWPQTGSYRAYTEHLASSTYALAVNNFKAYAERQKYSELGFIGAQNVSLAGMNVLEALEGQESVQYDYTAWCKTMHALLDQGYVPPTDLSDEQKTCFADWLEAHEKLGSCPTTPEALAYAQYSCGWKFVRE